MSDINTLAALSSERAAQSQPEFARFAEVKRLTGLTRSTLYRLLKQGTIKSAKLPVTGRKSGVRVFEMDSIRQFIQNQIQKGANPNA